MKRLMMYSAVVFLWATNAWAEEPLTDVQQIVEKANVVSYYQGDDGKSKVNMTITSAQGQTRNRELIILRKNVEVGGDQKYLVYFRRPADVRKMMYLVLKHVGGDDDRWLYLPDLGYEKRIAASDKRTSFAGSDFLYEDVSGRGLAEDEHSLMETTDQYYVVKNVPKDPASVEFKYFTVAIDRTNFVPMKMEFFGPDDKLYREIVSEQVEVIDGFPTVVKSLVKDHRSGSQTLMEFSEVSYNLGLSDDIFTNRSFTRPPREATR